MMKQFITFFTSGMFIALALSCSKEPKADFKFDKESYNVGEFVRCINNSTNAKSVKWTFPDGSVSTLRNVDYPVKAGTDAGIYPVKLEVFYGRSKSDEVTKSFIVNESPGTLSVWASQSANPLTVYIDNEYWGQLSVFFNTDPGCEAAGCLSKVLTPGNHTIQSSNGTSIWSNTVTIGKNSCVSFKVN